MAEHDWNMPHDMRYALEDSGNVLGCPPNCPVALAHLDAVFATVLKEESSVVKSSVYISGPMRGQPDDNFAVFNCVENTLILNGYLVFNPASKGHLTDEYPWQEAIKTDIEWVMTADYICLLPGWDQSEGARLEISVARALGKKFMQAIDGLEDGWVFADINTPNAASVEGIDAEARRLVYGARAQTYGHPRGDFDCIGGIWAAMLEAKVKFWAFQNGVELPDIPFHKLITAELVSTMMTGLKLARQVKSPEHRDTGVDAIGYQLCLQRVQEDPAETAAWERRPSSDSVPTFEGHDPV